MSKNARWICAIICFIVAGGTYNTNDDQWIAILMGIVIIILLFAQRKPGHGEDDDMGLT